MRSVPALFLLLAACSGGTPRETGGPQAPPLGEFAAATGARLCIAFVGDSLRAGLFVPALGSNANCSMAGRIERAAAGWALVPQGEGGCRIGLKRGLQRDGNGLRTAPAPAACAYYCGPGANLTEQHFSPAASGAATDIAGARLC